MMTEQALECQICRPAIPDSYIVFANDCWRLRHSLETNILGYCILESRRHFLDLSEANERELACYGKILAATMKVQREILHCQRVYTFSLAEAVPHFHLHVIPRAQDFLRAYKGRGIMSYPTNPSCDSSLVETLVERFQVHWRRFIGEIA